MVLANLLEYLKTFKLVHKWLCLLVSYLSCCDLLYLYLLKLGHNFSSGHLVPSITRKDEGYSIYPDSRLKSLTDTDRNFVDKILPLYY